MNDETFMKGLEKVLSVIPKDTQETVLLSSLMSSDLADAVKDVDSIREKLLKEIKGDVEKLSFTELILLR